MNLWFSHLLVAGLVLTTSALTPEECQPLLKPLSLADSSMLHGRLNFIMGYTDFDAYNAILNITESYWMKMTPSPSDKNELMLHEENKINGSCIGLSFNMTIDGDHVDMSQTISTLKRRKIRGLRSDITAEAVRLLVLAGDALIVPNMTTVFQVLPGCDGCMVFRANSTARNLGKLFHQMNINMDITDEEVTSHALYLMARETSVKDPDLEQFKQQASCLGFTGEPDFKYDPKNDFCAEGEGSHLSLS